MRTAPVTTKTVIRATPARRRSLSLNVRMIGSCDARAIASIDVAHLSLTRNCIDPIAIRAQPKTTRLRFMVTYCPNIREVAIRRNPRAKNTIPWADELSVQYFSDWCNVEARRRFQKEAAYLPIAFLRRSTNIPTPARLSPNTNKPNASIHAYLCRVTVPREPLTSH